MTFYAKFCIDCGKEKERKEGVCCNGCLKKRKKETMKRYKKNNPERIKAIRKNYVKRHPKKCIDCGIEINMESTRCRNCSGKNRFKKRIIKDKSGYLKIFTPKHPFADEKGYVWEHRLVVEKKIGRILTKDEVVHHIDTKKGNNNIKNLMLFPTHKEHMKFHTKIVQFGYTGPVLKQIENRWRKC